MPVLFLDVLRAAERGHTVHLFIEARRAEALVSIGKQRDVSIRHTAPPFVRSDKRQRRSV